MNATLRCAIAAAAITLALSPAPARADVPFHRVYLTNGVEVEGQDKFPDWVVLVFPGGPPSGRPVAWPSLVEPGFQTAIDRQTLGTPRLWIVPRAALDDLLAAARENDDALDGPVAELLKAKGADCGKIDLQETAELPMPSPDRRLIKYRLEAAAPGKCVMKQLEANFTFEEFKRPPSWAKFAPRRKKKDAGAADAAASAAPSTSASAAPVPSTSASAAPAVSARPADTRAGAGNEPEVPEPKKGCGACVVGQGRSDASAIASIFAVGAAIAARGRKRRRA